MPLRGNETHTQDEKRQGDWEGSRELRGTAKTRDKKKAWERV